MQATQGGSPWLTIATEKLERVLGPERAPAIIDEILRELGLDTLESPEQLALFGQRLARRGGFLSPLGASLQIQASMHQTRARI
ncbi:MAG: hypothetical protein M4D80_09930 [Myxococcota bacterium]|nr:hypothetical protein [Deltaproteobacteria bacterium]MDQ3335472.1 hypothetical protein [Myxococcota bacterium]